MFLDQPGSALVKHKEYGRTWVPKPGHLSLLLVYRKQSSLGSFSPDGNNDTRFSRVRAHAHRVFSSAKVLKVKLSFLRTSLSLGLFHTYCRWNILPCLLSLPTPSMRKSSHIILKGGRWGLAWVSKDLIVGTREKAGSFKKRIHMYMRVYVSISIWGVSDSPALLGLFHFLVKSLLGTFYLVLFPELTFLGPVPPPTDIHLLKRSALNSESTLSPAEKKKRLCWCHVLGCTRTEVRFFCISEKQWIGFFVLPLSSTIKNSTVRIPERRVGQGLQLVLWGHGLAVPTQLKRRKSTWAKI